MSGSQKYPLVMVDPAGEIKRVFSQLLEPVWCPYGDRRPCTYYCAMFGLVDNNTDMPGIVCRSHGQIVPIGIVDPETFCLDLLEALRAGSDLYDHIVATNKPKDSE